jgi:hypothetical protein
MEVKVKSIDIKPVLTADITLEFNLDAEDNKFKVGDQVWYFGCSYIIISIGLDSMVLRNYSQTMDHFQLNPNGVINLINTRQTEADFF